jgi:multisubunit Na+/H+ antiporter MnhG subunit
MRTRNYGLYAIALAIVVIGALALGLPLNTLVVLGLVLACPLMMMFMMRGMHGTNTPERQRQDASDRSHEHGGLH